MKLNYKENKVEEGKIPEVVRKLKVGDLVSLVGKENDLIAKCAGHVIGISFVTPEIRNNSQAPESLEDPDYLIELHALHPSKDVKIENTTKVPASSIIKYCIIKNYNTAENKPNP